MSITKRVRIRQILRILRRLEIVKTNDFNGILWELSVENKYLDNYEVVGVNG